MVFLVMSMFSSNYKHLHHHSFICVLLLVTTIATVYFRACFAHDTLASFVFGDSLLEVGNNNYIVSLSKANCIPNGIDFGGPTGRFTNGRTILDVIGQELGLKHFIPPYLAPSTVGDVIFDGVNYASGSSGILNETGKVLVGRINLDAQLDNFANTRQYIISRIGVQAASDFFKKSLFSVAMGSNDFLNNYLVPIISIPEQKSVPPNMFIEVLITRYRLQLTRLYNLGARKIVVANVPPIGCVPYQRDLNPSAGDSCVAYPNQLAMLFNEQLKTLVLDELSYSLHGSKFVIADVYRIALDIILNYQSYGFENSDTACCYAAGRFGGLLPCGPKSKVCSDRSKYVFWDAFHPSDAVNLLIAKRLFDGDSDDIFPVNVRQLAESH